VTPPVRVGTSSWSSTDWRGAFYPEGAAPAEFLAHYARRFDTVECDATFYRTPSERTVDGWRAALPERFVFSAKLPREITHDRGLVDCSQEVASYLRVMERLGDRLGAIVAQFAYIARGRDAREYATGDDFRRRLARFLEAWPRERELAVEVRNAAWIAPPLLDLLREHGTALVIPVYYTLPGPERFFGGADPQITELLYVRFLGDHRKMDELVARQIAEGRRSREWEALAVDREAEMRSWVRPLRERAAAGARVFAYFNNHYAGFAPGSAWLFERLWREA
jgi:uncharacterized protein YecE (DUF72 family)